MNFLGREWAFLAEAEEEKPNFINFRSEEIRRW